MWWVELIRPLWVGWGKARGGASVGLQRDDEETLMRVVIGADRRCFELMSKQRRIIKGRKRLSRKVMCYFGLWGGGIIEMVVNLRKRSR